MGTETHPADFRERTATQIVAGRLAGRKGATNAFVIRAVEHVHALIRETRPSREDCRAALAFLGEVGQAADERHAEWLLLCDLLGVTALIEEVNANQPRGATPSTARGPFYREGAPRHRDGANICLAGDGEPMAVTIHIRDLDGHPIPGAELETWQADGHGRYENQHPDLQPEWNLCGTFRSDAAGTVRYQTVRPAGYGVPSAGPVGALGRRLGLSLRRPAHLSFIVRASGFVPLTAELFDRHDPHLADDAIFGVRPPLLTDFVPSGGGFAVEHAFVLARSPRHSRP